jgi:hypothetical protein
MNVSVIWSVGWREANYGGPWWCRHFGNDNSQMVFRRPGLGTEGGPIEGVGESFFPGRKLHLLTPKAAMPSGTVTLLGAPLWVLSCIRDSCKTPWPQSSGWRHVITLLGSLSWCSIPLGLGLVSPVASFASSCTNLFICNFMCKRFSSPSCMDYYNHKISIKKLDLFYDKFDMYWISKKILRFPNGATKL